MKKLILIGLLAILAGCASNPGAGQEGESFVVTGHTYDEIFDASARVLERDLNHVASRADKRNGYIKAVTQMSLTSWGEYVTVAIRADLQVDGQYVVLVHSQKANKWQRSGKAVAEPIAAGIRAELGIAYVPALP